MTELLLNDAEKTFILHGVNEDLRCDGRSRRDYRPMELETEIVSHASGSARLRLANTDILVGVKAEIDVPLPNRENEGRLEFFVDCSANATPAFEGRGGDSLAMDISCTLQKAFSSGRAFDLHPLCIIPGKQCWKLFTDILILECGGNLFDAVSLAVKAALFNTQLPRVTTAPVDGGDAEVTISDNPFDFIRLNIETVPILITLCKIGDHCVVDPGSEEEECSAVSLVVAVSNQSGKYLISSIKTMGNGSLSSDTLTESMQLAVTAGECLNKALMFALEHEDSLPRGNIFGFFK